MEKENILPEGFDPGKYYIDDSDYYLKLLSEANGITLLVSEKGQVFWVKHIDPNKVELTPLNKGKTFLKYHRRNLKYVWLGLAKFTLSSFGERVHIQNKMTEEPTTPEASFNQAVYQQRRIDELLLRVDRLGTNPLFYNSEYKCYNYEIIFRDLCSLLATISAKLKKEDKDDVFKIKDKIFNLFSGNSIWKITHIKKFYSEGKLYSLNYAQFKILSDDLFEFRIKLEYLMDKYGYGNPTKDDPRKSASRR